MSRVKCIGYIGKGVLNSHLGSNPDPCCIQNRVITNRVIKRLRCTNTIVWYVRNWLCTLLGTAYFILGIKHYFLMHFTSAGPLGRCWNVHLSGPGFQHLPRQLPSRCQCTELYILAYQPRFSVIFTSADKSYLTYPHLASGSVQPRSEFLKGHQWPPPSVLGGHWWPFRIFEGHG